MNTTLPAAVESPRHILVAEDDSSDAFFLQRAFEKAGFAVRLHFTKDGQEVIDYLRGAEPFSDRQAHPLPHLLLLDLKMPRLNGFDVLRWIKEQPKLKRLLVIIFSSSEEVQDINQAYDLGANSYVAKPHAFEDLQGIVDRLKKYWLEVNKKPDYLLG
ncbi:Response regulator receiver protein [Verrucomicrobia bacterium]|nr:Response regulator receiver protein [Verrucomicrobiota bacterium]